MLPKPLVVGFKLDVWTRIATTIAILVYLSVAAASLAFPEVDARLVLLTVGLVFLGMPHGALDVYLAIKLFRNLPLFVFIYGFLSVLVFLLWYANPTLAFVLFIVTSLYHFADSDVQSKNSLRTLELLARAPLPFCLSFLFFEGQTLNLIGKVHSEINFLPFVLYFKAFGVLGLFLTLVYFIQSAFEFYRNEHSRDLNFLEPLVLCVLFTQLNPLYALGIYFCFIHSIKHIVNVVKNIEIDSYLSILPFWIIPLAGIGFVIFGSVLSGSVPTELMESQLMSHIFVTLSALTLPHLIVIRYCKYQCLLD